VVALYTTVCPVTEVATPTSTTTLHSTHTITEVITKHVYSNTAVPVLSSASAYPVVSSASAYPINSANYTGAVTKVVTMSVVAIPYKEVNGTSSAPYGYVAATGVTVSTSGTPAYTTSAPAQYTGAASRAGVGMSVVAVLVAGLLAL